MSEAGGGGWTCVQGVDPCLSQTLLPSLTWNHFACPPPQLPLALSFLSPQTGGRIGFPLQLKGLLQSIAGDEKMTIFPPPSSISIRLFFQVTDRERKETITCGLEPGGLEMLVWEGRGPGIWRLEEEKSETSGKAQEKLPSPHSAILIPSCPKVFPIMLFSLRVSSRRCGGS